jgi:DNA-directed RNA polymerase sigma subunit (sigma70/sigma32)
LDAIYDNCLEIQRPRELNILINKINRIRTDFEKKHHGSPTDKQLAEAVGISIEKLQHINNLPTVCSLEQLKHDNQNLEPKDTNYNIEEYLDRKALRESLETLLHNSLGNSRKEKIIKMRFGITEDKEELGVECIANDIGVSKQAISGSVKNSLATLRANRNLLEPYIDFTPEY